MRGIIYNNEGRILRLISVPEDSINDQINTGEYLLEGVADIWTNYIEDGLIKLIPSKPSKYHTWDWANKIYVLSNTGISDSKLDINQLIETKRGSLALTPITYDNKTLDADTQAQSNINGKLQEIFAREAISSPLVSGEMFWKDTNNVIHSWSNQTDYKLWLQGLVIAISSRNTQLYSIAWTKKAEVEALTGIDDILAYDINSGWT
jgi:hypothetical protein